MTAPTRDDAERAELARHAKAAENWDFLRRVVIIAVVVAVALALWRLSDILLLLFGSVLVATILHSLAKPISHYTGLPNGYALLIAGLGLLALVAAGVLLFGEQVGGQLRDISKQVPEAITTLEQRLEMPNLRERILRHAGSASGTILANVAAVTLGVFTAVADLVLVIVGGVFLALSPQLYRDGVVRLFHEDQRDRIRDTLNYSGVALQKWLAGQVVAMAIVGTLVTIGLTLIGMPSALGLGFIAGLAEFVPIVGPILGAIPAVLLAFSQGWSMVFWVAGIFLLIQQIESNMITPMVHRHLAALPPALTLFSVIAFGTIFGHLGLLFASPLTIVFYVAIKKLYVRDILGDETEIPGAPQVQRTPDAAGEPASN